MVINRNYFIFEDQNTCSENYIQASKTNAVAAELAATVYLWRRRLGLQRWMRYSTPRCHEQQPKFPGRTSTCHKSFFWVEFKMSYLQPNLQHPSKLLLRKKSLANDCLIAFIRIIILFRKILGILVQYSHFRTTRV